MKTHLTESIPLMHSATSFLENCAMWKGKNRNSPQLIIQLSLRIEIKERLVWATVEEIFGNRVKFLIFYIYKLLLEIFYYLFIRYKIRY
jgi:hypothetical protein